MFVTERDVHKLRRIRERARNMYALPGEQRRGKGQALDRVMVPGAQHDRDAACGQLRQHMAQQLHRVSRRGAAVIDVARDEHGIRLHAVAEHQKAFDPYGLIAAFQQRDAVYGLSEMQIRKMQKSHGISSVC